MFSCVWKTYETRRTRFWHYFSNKRNYFFPSQILFVQWNPALRTPAYNGQFRLSRQKAHIFSLKLTHFIRRPVNRDNGHFSVSWVTLLYCQPRFMDTGYLRTVYFHCHNYVVIVDIVPCSTNEIFTSTWLSRKLKASAQSKVTEFFKWITVVPVSITIQYTVLKTFSSETMINIVRFFRMNLLLLQLWN